MELKKTKQPIMGLAALLIILYHLFPVSRNNDMFSSSIRYIVMTGYIGVDIFFFMSGYMSYFSKTDNYFQYVKRKFMNIYPIFILSCILFIVMGKLSVKRALFTISGIDLFMSGGGSFLWFIPAIMIFYLAVPLYRKLISRFGNIQTFAVGMAVWAVMVFAIDKILTNHSINIFLCRIPIILFGAMLAKYEEKWKQGYKLTAGILLLVAGIFLTWKFGYTTKANFLISDSFYIIAIPQVLGILLVSDVVFAKLKTYFFEFLGKLSLELYCFQMVFGAVLFGRAIMLVGNRLLAFLIVFILILVLSHLMHTGRKRI